MNNMITIIIPCYNQAVYLDECLESVINQTYNNWECVIINDGSNDDSENKALNWVKKDNRIKYIYQNNLGVSAARNNGIKCSKSKFILPLDADDKIAPEYIEKALDEFSKTPNLTLVYCLANKFGLVNESWYLGQFNLYDLAVDNKIFCSAIFKKSDWEKIGGYDETMRDGVEDWEFWINLLKSGGKVTRLDYLGFYYRIKGTSRQIIFNKKDKSETIYYIVKKHPDFFYKAATHHQRQYKLLLNITNSLKLSYSNLIVLIMKKIRNKIR